MSGDLLKVVARLSERVRRTLEQVRIIAADASSAPLLADRFLSVLSESVPYDDAALFTVDAQTLVFNRLLAYRGEDPHGLHVWIRDVYQVAREPGALGFPALLRHHGGSGTLHEDGDRWLRVTPPPVSSRELREGWRMWDSPPGGALRYGFPHRRRWVAALQLSRLEPGRGFRPNELEVLDRLAPMFGAALALRLEPGSGPRSERLGAGQLTFDAERRLLSISSSGRLWLDKLADDSGAPAMPVAVQSLVGHLAASEGRGGTLVAFSKGAWPALVHGEPALVLDAHAGPQQGFSVTIESVAATGGGLLTGAQHTVARHVAAGDSDREIAAALHLSVATVHEHVAALHRLLDTSTRPRLVAALAGTAFGRPSQ